jgi:hypothetical protein
MLKKNPGSHAEDLFLDWSTPLRKLIGQQSREIDTYVSIIQSDLPPAHHHSLSIQSGEVQLKIPA